jgi:hypothetical protein
LLAGMFQAWGNGGIDRGSVLRILHKIQNSTRFAGLTTWTGVRDSGRFAYTLCSVKVGELVLKRGT